MASSAGKKKVAHSLVALSSSAIVVVYAAGFIKTRAAASKLEEASNERRPPMPAPSTAGETRPPEPIEPPTKVVPTATTLRSPVMPKPDPPSTPTTVAKNVLVAPKADQKLATPSVASVTPAPVVQLDAATTTAVPPAASGPPPAASETTVSVSKSDDKPAGEKPAGKLWPKEHYNDGTYLGWGTSRHGDIQASVTITDGRITETSIARCLTRYSCAIIAHLPPQVVKRQSPDCDYVSGATQSANAFYYAVVDALSKAK